MIKKHHADCDAYIVKGQWKKQSFLGLPFYWEQSFLVCKSVKPNLTQNANVYEIDICC